MIHSVAHAAAEPFRASAGSSKAPDLGAVPSILKSAHRWVTWRFEVRGNKRTKRPFQSVASSGEWLSFTDACGIVAANRADGIGYVLGDGIVGIDLDGCIGVEGQLHEIARDLVELGTYVERSPSRSGLHAFIQATITRSKVIRAGAGIPGREIYDGSKGSSRYFTVTGDRIGGFEHLRTGPDAQVALDAFVAKWFPEQGHAVGVGGDDNADEAEALNDEGVLQVMFGARDGKKWRRIFDGDDSEYLSQSEADLALCRKLRFYTRRDAKQMDRLFRRSGLMREKWDEKRGGQTYGERTIAQAIANGGPLYTPRDTADDAKARDLWLRKAWFGIPAWVWVRLGGAGELACRVYGIIASHADNDTGEAWPTVETIAAHLRVTERRVKTALQVLKAANLLTWTRRPRDSNLYRLALTVPETITPYATRGDSNKSDGTRSLRVPLSRYDN